MTPEDRDAFMFRFQAAWPRPIEASHAVFWNDMLSPLNAERSMAALTVCIGKHARRPAWSEFKECYEAQRSLERPLPKPVCGMCDDGWVDVTPEEDKKGFIGTVMRCPNGCMPMRPEERAERNRIEDQMWRDAENKRRVDQLIGTAAEATQRMDSRYEVDRETERF